MQSTKASTQKPDETALITRQNKLLNDSKVVEFLKSLNPDGSTVFGVKSKPRKNDPTMCEIFTWGYEAPVKEDYSKNKACISNKIRKSGRANVTEAQDNYRQPHKAGEQDLLFNYFDQDSRELWKRTFLNRAEEKEQLNKNCSEYREMFSNETMEKNREVARDATVAGKSRLNERPMQLKLPVNISQSKFEEALRRHGFQEEDAHALTEAFYHVQSNQQAQEDPALQKAVTQQQEPVKVTRKQSVKPKEDSAAKQQSKKEEVSVSYSPAELASIRERTQLLKL